MDIIKWIKSLYFRFEETVNYLFFGVLAFLVNMGAYELAARVLGADEEKVFLVLLSTAFAWITAVLFAYWTNRTFVFKSRVKEKKAVWKEFSSFISARIVTGLMELLIMFVMVDMGSINDRIAKFVCNVVVIATNYIFSKLWVFSKKEG